jgi:Na+/proline symporter
MTDAIRTINEIIREYPADTVILIAYLLGITALGVWMARRVHTIGDFFMPRRFGKAMMITHAFGTGTASDQAVTVASATFTRGLSGIWYQWMWLFCTPFYWLIAPIMRRFRALTTADVLTLRYNHSVAVLYAVVGMVNLSVKIGLVLKGSSVLVDSCTGGAIPANAAIAVITVLFVLYGMAGGLGAAIITDFVQGILTVLFSFILLPFVFHAVGGMAGIHQTISDPAMLSLVAPGKISFFFIVMFAVQALVGIVGQPFIMGVCAAGRTEMDGRVGFMVGNIVKRLCTIAWSLTAIAAVAWYINRGVDLSTVHGDDVYGDVARTFLPRVMPGLLGVFLASLLASVMSSCDSYMIASSGLFTENIYKPLVPGKSNSHYIFVGRAMTLVVVAGGLIFAYWVSGVVKALEIWLKIAPMMGIVFWMGLLWRRTTVAGAWTAAVVGFGSWFLATRGFFVDWASGLPFAESLRLIWQESGKPPVIYEPWVILLYAVSATLAAVIVSLLTKPVSREKLDRFYALTRTPIQRDEVIETSCTLPEGVEPSVRPILTTAFGLEIPAPSRVSIVGFILGWLAVVVLIAGFAWLVSP